jgi:hypothetical protein
MLKLAGLCRGGDPLTLDSHPRGHAPGRVRRLPLTPAPEVALSLNLEAEGDRLGCLQVVAGPCNKYPGLEVLLPSREC